MGVSASGVLDAINKAADLFGQAVEAYDTARDSLSSLADPNSADLEVARTKLNLAKARAEHAHNALDEAIEARLKTED